MYTFAIDGVSTPLSFERVSGLVRPQSVQFEGSTLDLIQGVGPHVLDVMWPNTCALEVRLVNQSNHVLYQWDILDAQFVDQFAVDANQKQWVSLFVGRVERSIGLDAWRYLEQWALRPPDRVNQWSSLTFEQRRVWLHALTVMTPYSQCGDGDLFDLDGRYITDYAALFIALGEAIHGPCGYYGSNLDALVDCFHGGFGPTPPFHVRWHHSEVAQNHLSRQAWNYHTLQNIEHVDVRQFLDARRDGPSLWDVFCDILGKHHITVDLL